MVVLVMVSGSTGHIDGGDSGVLHRAVQHEHREGRTAVAGDRTVAVLATVGRVAHAVGSRHSPLSGCGARSGKSEISVPPWCLGNGRINPDDSILTKGLKGTGSLLDGIGAGVISTGAGLADLTNNVIGDGKLGAVSQTLHHLAGDDGSNPNNPTSCTKSLKAARRLPSS
jgi:hypothetical protein